MARTATEASRRAAAHQASRRMIARDDRPAYRVTADEDGRWGVDTLPWVTLAATGRREALDEAPAAIAAWLGYRDVNLPTGTALIGNWSDCDIYIGSEFRIDVSSEAGDRFQNNTTGFRGEEEMGFNATPYVATGRFVKILGL